MKNPANNIQAQLILGSLVIVTAIVLGLTRFKLPAKNGNLNYPTTANINVPSTTNASSTNSNIQNSMTYSFPGQLPADQIANKQVRLMTSKGEIVFALDAAQAPLAVSNFVYLASQGYYNGLRWHRVVPGFVIQGGDPLGNGTGGPGYKFADEAVTSEYTAGTVAMANSGPNTNGSQFFIVLEDQPGLPKLYTIFGQVTSGMDVVRAITPADTMTTVIVEPTP